MTPAETIAALNRGMSLDEFRRLLESADRRLGHLIESRLDPPRSEAPERFVAGIREVLESFTTAIFVVGRRLADEATANQLAGRWLEEARSERKAGAVPVTLEPDPDPRRIAECKKMQRLPAPAITPDLID